MYLLKLWLLDADVIIGLFSLDLFDKLTNLHEINASSTVINEVKFCIRQGNKIPIPFRAGYVDAGLVHEVSADADEVAQILAKLPVNRRDVLHAGELESLAVLMRDDHLVFCSCDAATIRALPFLDLSERGISVENLLKTSGLSQSNLKDMHTENYFKTNLAIGKQDKIEQF